MIEKFLLFIRIKCDIFNNVFINFREALNLMKSILLILYFAVLIGIGLYCRKHATNVDGFVLGGRSVGPWLTAFAYGTSYFSAVVFVGYAGQFGWRYGIAATWAGIGNALIGSLMAWFILGRRTRIMSQHLDSATMPQFFGKRFGTTDFHDFSEWLSILTTPFVYWLWRCLLQSMSSPADIWQQLSMILFKV